jgi:hypothetical protein
MGDILSNLGKTIGIMLEQNEKRDEAKRHVVIELIRKSHSFDELNDVIDKYGNDDSVALTLALILQTVEIRFKDMELKIEKLDFQSKVMQEQIKELEQHILAVARASHPANDSGGGPRTLRWTAKQKEIRSMLERGMSFTEIVNSGHSKANVSRVKAALRKE